MKPGLISICLAMAIALAGCRTATVYNAQAVPFAAAPVTTPRVVTLTEVEAAIIRAGAQRGWVFERVGPGHLIGNVAVRAKHYATVDVMFDTETFSILYKDSRNLNYDASQGVIHPNYNSWIQNLEGDIQQEITILKAS